MSAFRELPEALKADPPPLSTGLLFGTSEKELIDPYGLSKQWIGEDRIRSAEESVWRYAHTALNRECISPGSLLRASVCFALPNLGPIEGRGCDGLQLWGKRIEMFGSLETLGEEAQGGMVERKAQESHHA